MPSVHVKIFLKVGVDLLILCIAGLLVLLFYLIGVPYQRGFFCDDNSIRYPYRDSTVSSGVLYAVGTAIPVIAIICIEYFHIRNSDLTIVKREKYRLWFCSLYRFIGIFIFGCAISHLTVDICKYSIGRLRPHFIDVCDPDWSKVDCTTEGAYTIEDVCTPNSEEEKDLLREARLSFISGHSSFSMYTMFYLIFYLQYRFCLQGYNLVRPIFQYICFGLAVYTSLTRISDYKHHWLDVLCGAANGVLFAVFCAFWVAKIRSTQFYDSSDAIRMCNLNTHNTNQEGP